MPPLPPINFPPGLGKHIDPLREALAGVVKRLALPAVLAGLPRIPAAIAVFVPKHAVRQVAQGEVVLEVGVLLPLVAALSRRGLVGLVLGVRRAGRVRVEQLGRDGRVAVQREEVHQRGAGVGDGAGRAVEHAPVGHEQARVHVAVGQVVGDEGVPAADGDVGLRVHEGEVVVGEEAHGPVVVVRARVLEGLASELVDGLVTRLVVGRGDVFEAVFVAKGEHVLVGPEVVGPVARDGKVEEEVLQLREVQEHRCLNHIDTEHGELRVVEVEGILQGELAPRISEVSSGVFDNIYLRGRPPCGDVGDHGLY